MIHSWYFKVAYAVRLLKIQLGPSRSFVYLHVRLYLMSVSIIV